MRTTLFLSPPLYPKGPLTCLVICFVENENVPSLGQNRFHKCILQADVGTWQETPEFHLFTEQILGFRMQRFWLQRCSLRGIKMSQPEQWEDLTDARRLVASSGLSFAVCGRRVLAGPELWACNNADIGVHRDSGRACRFC